ncbi:hypothetical protein OSB04_009805 [Centaurea solstitialis]|uniref:Protein TIFY n=1 Tax=Centaurea solstitialis TaxID=347529 RepID=A0AA38TH65_9ASTR|nr:hypothetical protein OSB04_009805 [Centaurea solstitialis]
MAAAVLLLNIMAQNNTTTTNAIDDEDDVKPTILHDFLGPTSSPSASISGGGARGGAAAGGAPVSTTSDLGSERGKVYISFDGKGRLEHILKGCHSLVKKVIFRDQRFGTRGVNEATPTPFSWHRHEKVSPVATRLPETSHLMKMLRNVGGERPRWPHEDESFMGMHQMRPAASPLMVQQPATGGKTDANTSKWERAIPVNVGPVLQYPPRAAAQVLPYGYQPVSNRFKDTNMGSSVISQSAADEGSRTGIKGSGILSSVMAEPSSSKHKSLNSNTEPGSSTPLQRQGSTSGGRQMTIFYGGQAHVFDDVHPNKADVIMALAGSNGGSWSTSFSPNSAVKPSGGEAIAIPVSGENDMIVAAKTSSSSKDNLVRLYGPGSSSHGLGSNDRMLMLSGKPTLFFRLQIC